MKSDTSNTAAQPSGPSLGSSPQGRRGLQAIIRKPFSFPVFLAMLLLAAVFVGRMLNMSQPSSARSATIFWLEGDAWWHLAVGKQILKTHTWPTHDHYSFTAPGSPWIAYEWLGEVVTALAWRMDGLQGLMILLMLLGSGVLFLLYYYVYLRSGNSKAAFVACALVLPLASLSMTLRPQLLGYVYLVAALILVEKFRQGHDNALWLLPPLFLLWVNTHGTFVFGFLILGVYWASGLKAFRFGGLYAEQWTTGQRLRLEATALLCLLASMVTPYGARLLAYPLELASSQHLIVRTVQEWEPFNLSQTYGKYFLVLLLIFWVALVTSRLKCRLQDFLLLLLAIAETFMHARFILLFVPLFAPVLAELLRRWIPPYDSTKDQYVLNAVLMAVIVAAIVKFFPSNQYLEKNLEYKMPVRAVAYVGEHPALGQMFNDAYWGGYMIAKLGATHKVFIDGRFDIYEYSGVLADYLSIIRLAPNTRFLLRKYHVQSCLIPRESPLAVMLHASRRWQEVYQDEVSAIFVRLVPQPSVNTATRSPGKSYP